MKIVNYKMSCSYKHTAQMTSFLYGFSSMPCEVKPRFVVLYGSQKGQAQSIAEGIAEEAEEHGLVADLSCLNENEKVHSSFHLCSDLSRVL